MEKDDNRDFLLNLSYDSSGFVVLNDYLDGAKFDIKYYSDNNFVGRQIAGYKEPLAIATIEAAETLRDINRDLISQGLCLKIFDAYRPVCAVRDFVSWAKDIDDIKMKSTFYPKIDKKDLIKLGYISPISCHSRGSTIDLTLFDLATGRDVDMGGEFDYFGELSNSDYRGISDEQFNNRLKLRDEMTRYGFRPLENEWWHFELIDEPFADTCFNFLINQL